MVHILSGWQETRDLSLNLRGGVQPPLMATSLKLVAKS